MKIRKLIAILLAASLAVAGIAGCSSKEGEEKEKKGAKGRYVENQVELPLKDDEYAVGLVAGEDKEAILFAGSNTGSTYKAYRYDGSHFIEEGASWLNYTDGQTVKKVVRGEDGSLYALYTDENEMTHVIKDMRNGSSQEILIPELTEILDMGIYPFVGNICVDADGNIFLGLPINGEVGMFDQVTGDKIRSFQTSEFTGQFYTPMDVKDKIILLGSDDGSGFTSYDTKSGAVKDEIEYSGQNLDGIVKLGDDNDCIYADSKGLHHMNLGGSVSEDLIGENESAFGIPNTGVNELIQLEQQDYMALIQATDLNGKSEYQLFRYAYDETAKAKPTQNLTIYGLKESNAVRHAIVKFQQKFPDVGIEYKTGNAGEGTGTKADSIRALNTELLGGSGADIIMLDGLPVDSYIEKGILADLGKVLKAVQKESDISNNIIDPYMEDGEIYQIPTRYGIPIMIGDQEKIEVLKTSEALKSYMKNHKWEDLIEMPDKNKLISLLVNIYYEDIVNEKQKINTELLAELIEIAGKAEDTGSVESVTKYAGGGESEEPSNWGVGKIGSIENEAGRIAFMEVKGVQGLMMPYHFLRKTNSEPSDVNDIFLPHDIAGINKASNHMDLAEEFVKMLLSEEVQSVDVESGFPVNEQAMDAIVQNVEETPGDGGIGLSISSSASTEDGEVSDEPSVENIKLPYRSEVQSFAELGKSLTIPVQKDDIIGEMILDGAKTYFEGSRTAEEAAKDIAEKADTYLAE